MPRQARAHGAHGNGRQWQDRATRPAQGRQHSSAGGRGGILRWDADGPGACHRWLYAMPPDSNPLTPRDIFLSPDLTSSDAASFLEGYDLRDSAAADQYLQQLADDLTTRVALGNLAGMLLDMVATNTRPGCGPGRVLPLCCHAHAERPVHWQSVRGPARSGRRLPRRSTRLASSFWMKAGSPPISCGAMGAAFAASGSPITRPRVGGRAVPSSPRCG